KGDCHQDWNPSRLVQSVRLRGDDRKLIRLRLVFRVIEEKNRPLLLLEMSFDRLVVRGLLAVAEPGGAFANFRGGKPGSRRKLVALEESRHFLVVTGEIHDRLVAPERHLGRSHRKPVSARPMSQQGSGVLPEQGNRLRGVRSEMVSA